MLHPEDIEITSGSETRGGQHCGVDRSVKVYHKPTGTTVICSFGRSGHKNREIALSMLEWGLLEDK